MKKLLIYMCTIFLSSPLLAMEKDDDQIIDPYAEMSHQIAQRYKKKAAELDALFPSPVEDHKLHQETFPKDELKKEDAEKHIIHADIGFLPETSSSSSSKYFKEACLANKAHIDKLYF